MKKLKLDLKHLLILLLPALLVSLIVLAVNIAGFYRECVKSARDYIVENIDTVIEMCERYDVYLENNRSSFFVLDTEADGGGLIVNISGDHYEGVSIKDAGLDEACFKNGFDGHVSYNSDDYMGVCREFEFNGKKYEMLYITAVDFRPEGTDARRIGLVIILVFILTTIIVSYSGELIRSGASVLTHRVKTVVLAIMLFLAFYLSVRFLYRLYAIAEVIISSEQAEDFIEDSLENTFREAMSSGENLSEDNRDYLKALKKTEEYYINAYNAQTKKKIETGAENEDDPGDWLDFCKDLPDGLDEYNYIDKRDGRKYFVHLFETNDGSMYISCAYDLSRIYNNERAERRLTALALLICWGAMLAVRKRLYDRLTAYYKKHRPVYKKKTIGDKVRKSLKESAESVNLELGSVEELLSSWRESSPEGKLWLSIKLAVFIIMLLIVRVSYNAASTRSSLIEIMFSGYWQRAVNSINLHFIVLSIIAIAISFNLIKDIAGALAVPFGRKVETYSKLIISVIQYGLVFAAIFYGSYLLGMEVKSVATLATVVTGVVGIGVQTLISDIGAGALMLYGGMVNVGDKVVTSGIRGTIKEVGIRSTIIEGEDGSVTMIGNSSMKTITVLPKPKEDVGSSDKPADASAGDAAD